MAITGTYAAGDAVSFKDCYIEVDLLGTNSTWAAIDSWATQVDVSGEDVPTTETYPFSGSAIVFTGNKSPVTLNVMIVFTEGTDDAYYQIRERFEAGSGVDFDVRFAPAGSATGSLQYTSSGGHLTACPPPSGAGDASTPTVVQFTVVADSIAEGIMA